MEIQDHTSDHTKSLLVIVRIMDERERGSGRTTVHPDRMISPDAVTDTQYTFHFDSSGLPIQD
jgi:hypothetical protein